MAKKTQRKMVEDKLKRDGYVDNFWGIENKITLRLSAIIFTLREEGWVFDDAKCGFVPGTKNWRYWLAGAKQPYQPKYRYEMQPSGLMREIEIKYENKE